MSPIHETVVEQSVKPGGVFHPLVSNFARERVYITRVAVYFEKARLLVSYKQVFRSQKSVEFSLRDAYPLFCTSFRSESRTMLRNGARQFHRFRPGRLDIRRGQVVF